MALIIIIIIICIVLCNKDKNRTTSKDEKKEITSNNQITIWPENPNNYTLNGTVLVHYNGNGDTLFVPIGTTIIGAGIQKNMTWHSVFIPKSVMVIRDLALFYVENVYYEGSSEEFQQILCDYSYNFRTGFIPTWAENLSCREYCKVKEVSFHYNVDIPKLYRLRAEQQKNEEIG